MITTVLCYSAISGIDVTVYDTPCRADMGNVGLNVSTALLIEKPHSSLNSYTFFLLSLLFLPPLYVDINSYWATRSSAGNEEELTEYATAK